MTRRITPGPHSDAWVNLLHGYVTDTVWALQNHGLRVQRSWLDPSDPRDATIVYEPSGSAATEALALVWDEEYGWRSGGFAEGRPGTRTTLTAPVHLGGGVLPAPADVAARAHGGRARPARRYRSYADLRDGLDDALRDR